MPSSTYSSSSPSPAAESGLPSASRWQWGYAQESVDPVLARARRALLPGGTEPPPITADELAALDFPRERAGYRITAVDQRLARLVTELRARERFRLSPVPESAAPPTTAPASPAGRSGSYTDHLTPELLNPMFGRAPIGRRGYDLDEVDAFIDMIVRSARRTLVSDRAKTDKALGAIRRARLRPPPLGQRGYHSEQVDDWRRRLIDAMTALHTAATRHTAD